MLTLAWRMRSGFTKDQPYIHMGSARSFNANSVEEAEGIIQRELDSDAVSWTEIEWAGHTLRTAKVKVSHNSRWEIQLH